MCCTVLCCAALCCAGGHGPDTTLLSACIMHLIHLPGQSQTTLADCGIYATCGKLYKACTPSPSLDGVPFTCRLRGAVLCRAVLWTTTKSYYCAEQKLLTWTKAGICSLCACLTSNHSSLRGARPFCKYLRLLCHVGFQCSHQQDGHSCPVDISTWHRLTDSS